MESDQLLRDSHVRTTALVVLTFIAVAASLYFLRDVLLPFVLALFIASGVMPVLAFVERFLEFSRITAVVITLGMSLVTTAVFCWVIWTSVHSLTSNQVLYEKGVVKMYDRALTVYESLFAKPPEAGDSPATPPVPAPEETPAATEELDDSQPLADADDPLDELDEELSATAVPRAKNPSRSQASQDFATLLKEQMGGLILRVSNELFSVLSSAMLVLIFLFFLLLGGTHVELPKNNLWGEVDSYVRNYIVAKTLISLVTGAVFGIVLWMFGIPLAFVFGMMAFLLNFIPNLGPIIASLLPVPLVWLLLETNWASEPGEAAEISMSVGRAIIALTLAAAVQFLSGNVVEPKIMGDRFKLHPIAILLSLMFWYMIWGLAGAFLAVPITSALKIALAESTNTRPVAQLLEGNLEILARRETEPVV